MKRGASRTDTLSRVAAAAVGGYALSATAAVGLALVLPVPRADAVLTGTMLSFIVYVCAVLWVFSAASATRAWTGLVLSAALLWAGLLAFGYRTP